MEENIPPPRTSQTVNLTTLITKFGYIEQIIKVPWTSIKRELTVFECLDVIETLGQNLNYTASI